MKLNNLSILLVTVFCSILNAKNINQPFGELKWEDGLYTSAVKLFEMGSTKIELGINSEFDSKPLLKPKSNKDVETALFKQYSKLYGSYSNTDWVLTDVFKDAKGNEAKYFTRSISLKASGIIIHGVKCNLELSFLWEPAVAVIYPENAFKHPKGFYFVPILNEVRISSQESNLKENVSKIRSTLADKYYKNADKEKDWFLQDGSFNVVDVRGQVKDNNFYLVYSNQSISELKEEYRKALSEIELNKNKNQKDMGANL